MICCLHHMNDKPFHKGLEHSLLKFQMTGTQTFGGQVGGERLPPRSHEESPYLESNPRPSFSLRRKGLFLFLEHSVTNSCTVNSWPWELCHLFTVRHNQPLSVLSALIAWTCHPMSHLKNCGINFRWPLRTLRVLMALIRFQVTIYGVLLPLFFKAKSWLKIFQGTTNPWPLMLLRYWRKSCQQIRRNSIDNFSIISFILVMCCIYIVVLFYFEFTPKDLSPVCLKLCVLSLDLPLLQYLPGSSFLNYWNDNCEYLW